MNIPNIGRVSKAGSKEMGQEEMMKQAQHIWAMLEDMSERDPAAYRAFIDKHIREGREVMKPPQPHMCIATKLLGSPSGRFFVNIFGWQTVKAPESEEAPIPVYGGHVYNGKDTSGDYQTICVAFHPSVLKDFGRECSSPEEQRMLIHLALSYINDAHKLSLSRDYSLLSKDELCKGLLKNAQESLTRNVNNSQENDFHKELGDLEEMFGPMATGCKDSLLKEMSNITASRSDDNESSQSEIEPSTLEPEIKMPFSAEGKKKGLIEEVPNHTKIMSEPQHSVQLKEDGLLQVKIKLPGICSVADCQLDISQSDLRLEVPDKYSLSLQLPKAISVEDSKAKFSKRSSVLTLTLPVQ